MHCASLHFAGLQLSAQNHFEHPKLVNEFIFIVNFVVVVHCSHQNVVEHFNQKLNENGKTFSVA